VKVRASAPHLEPPVVSEPPVMMQESSVMPELPVAPEPEVIAAASPNKPAPSRRPTRWRGAALAVAAAALLAIAALGFPARPSAPAAGDETVMPQPAAVRPAPDPVSATAFVAGPGDPMDRPQATVAARAVRSSDQKPAVAKLPKTAIARSPKSAAPSAAVTAVAESRTPVEAAPATTDSAATAAPTPALVSTAARAAAPVTITGCLEVSVAQDEFRLTDTGGVDAPKSRSWRSGFLKKRSTPVSLVEAPDTLALQSHVGRRVAATGMLTSHDLKVSGLRVVGPACN
jgi:hypothetical protein